MADLTFAGQDIRQAAARTSQSGIFFDLVAGYFEPAAVRGVDTIIPAAAGRIFRDRVSDSRRIALSGYVIGTTASDWRSKMQTLFSVMDPTADPANLVIGDNYLGTTGSPTIAARFVNAVGGEIVAGRFQTWSIELEAVTPDWS